VGAFPARAEEARQLAGAEAPVDPREHDAAHQENQEGAWQEVFHVRLGSRAAMI